MWPMCSYRWFPIPAVLQHSAASAAARADWSSGAVAHRDVGLGVGLPGLWELCSRHPHQVRRFPAGEGDAGSPDYCIRFKVCAVAMAPTATVNTPRKVNIGGLGCRIVDGRD